MAVYLPGIPQPTDTLADSQPDILNNFGLINTYIGVDHVAFNAASNQGKHNKVSFIGQVVGTDPVTVSGISLTAISSFGGTRYNLFYRENNGFTSLGKIQLTGSNAPINATRGSSNLPGGLMIQWGSDTLTGDLTTFNFPIAFGASFVPSVTITGQRSNAGTYDICINTGSINANNFTVRRASSSSITKITWIAIGPEL